MHGCQNFFFFKWVKIIKIFSTKCILITKEWERGLKTERKREKWKGGRVDRQGEMDEAGSIESSNDGSDQRTTCQTLEVISCFIEDFYGILAVWLTSQRDGETEREGSHLPPLWVLSLSLPFSSPSSVSPLSCLVEAMQSQYNQGASSSVTATTMARKTCFFGGLHN